jgi:hypothetical protein
MPGFRRTAVEPSLRAGLSMARPTTAMAPAKKISRLWPSMDFARVEPARAPTMPKAANRLAQGQRTRPARACPASAVRAFSDTPAADAPIATCGSRTPTT